MAKVDIRIEDNPDGTVETTFLFTPELVIPEEATPAQQLANELYQAIMKTLASEETWYDQNGRPIEDCRSPQDA